MRTPGFYRKFGYALTERPATKPTAYRMRPNTSTPPPADPKQIFVVVPPSSGMSVTSLGRRQ